MSKRLLVAIAIPLLAGCTATIESRFDPKTPYAPTNEIRGGVASYLNNGGRSITESRRKNAYKKMHSYCGGLYKILEEGESVGFGGVAPVGGAYVFNQQRKWMIRFECVSEAH